MVSTRYIALSGGLLQTCVAHISTPSPVRLLRDYEQSNQYDSYGNQPSNPYGNGDGNQPPNLYRSSGNYPPPLLAQYPYNDRFNPNGPGSYNNRPPPSYSSYDQNGPGRYPNGPPPNYLNYNQNGLGPYSRPPAYYPPSTPRGSANYDSPQPGQNSYPPNQTPPMYPPSRYPYEDPTRKRDEYRDYPNGGGQNDQFSYQPNGRRQGNSGGGVEELVRAIKRGTTKVDGVSLNWLLAESWLSPDNKLWDETTEEERYNERSFMNAPAKGKSRAELIDEYRKTWYTKDDLAKIKWAGYNTVQVSVGYWITNLPRDSDDAVFTSAIDYLDLLINQWASSLQLAVIVTLRAHKDCHNLEASSNCRVKEVNWGSPKSIEDSVNFALWIASRYEDSGAFLGMELLPNPVAPITQDQLEMYYSQVNRMLVEKRNDCILVIAGLDANDLLVWKDFTRSLSRVWLGYPSFVFWGFENKPKTDLFKEIEKRGEKLQTYAKEGLQVLVTGWAAAAPASAQISSPSDYGELIGTQMQAYSSAKIGSVTMCWKVKAVKYKPEPFDTESMLMFNALVPRGDTRYRL